MAIEEMLVAIGGIIAAVAAAITIPLGFQFVRSISGRMSESDILHKQFVNNVSANMSINAANVAEEVSKTTDQATKQKPT